MRWQLTLLAALCGIFSYTIVSAQTYLQHFSFPSTFSALFMDGNAKQRAELTSDLTPDLHDGVQVWRVM